MDNSAHPWVEAAAPPVSVCVLAHNEARRIALCLESLLADDPALPVHVVVNGSTDRTAEIAAGFARARPNVRVHIYPEGGKARSWNRFLFDETDAFSDVHVFVDGDAEIAAGSVAALAAALRADPHANAASGLPLNGRNVALYRAGLAAEHGLFGDLYALRGAFLARMKARGLRLPVDLIGDDGLIGALAKTDLGPAARWDERRVLPCPEAGFLCEPASLARPWTLRHQYRRMINYSVRHFQNRMLAEIVRECGPEGLPERLAQLYPQWLPRFAPRRGTSWWFDRAALTQMAGSAPWQASASRPHTTKT
ncbi:MAG: glycosyltransferase family A protein, partial [Allosphingosinicella sp.]